MGTTLYKLVNQPRLNGGYVKKRIVWNNETLRQDYGKDYLATVPKYDGFCTVPDHVDYRPVVDKFLNLYEPIGHRPQQGEFPCIRSLVRHIFGEQYELGMDYLQLLYLQPVQKLPILLLVSEERNTGKSTFLNFLKAVFQNNVTFNTNEDFRSQFNSDWAGKLLIVVDEVLLNRREDSERLKNLSTTLSYKVEAKGKDRDEIAFFAKFVLCSNNEYLPVIIDAGETRYWVRKIDRLQSDDTDFLQKLKAEIPAFLYYLQYRQLSTEKESRMWFAPSLLHTEALQKIIRSNRNRLEIEMCELILDIMESVGTAGNAVGKFIGSIPLVREVPVDEFLQDGGTHLKKSALDMEKDAVHRFASIGNPGTRMFMEKMDEMIQIYNRTEQICFDDKKIYLLPKKLAV